METKQKELFEAARALGFSAEAHHLHDLTAWLREEKHIHVEIGAIWDELTNHVESYAFTITAPISTYYIEPIYEAGGKTYFEMLLKGLSKALFILKQYNSQKHIEVADDDVVIAYLKGYGDKGKQVLTPKYFTNLEKYAYLQGKQGDYIEEGLTEDDIIILVKNLRPEDVHLKLEKD
ncbi:hypothetical protein JRG66_14820 [Salinimicrobium tongyeongense]|uniref:Uncharacterized protein n=1 Tax=Salinimicrobium tongyeongense TaxID=2809707 RepID=A0ABY6NQL7_9FLAO|nr:hypothetical protein [Salinimicrobium tongyeongense]UZH55206.1 hypothetical protein JRG66_14820 [Salinimicrobium tongyeongense]